MAVKMSVLGLIMSFPPYLRSAMVQFPFKRVGAGGVGGRLIFSGGYNITHRQKDMFADIVNFRLTQVAKIVSRC